MHNNALDVPDAAHQDPKAVEVLRVWVANNSQHVALRSGVWKDPAAWGIMLFDLLKHIANAYQQIDGIDQKAAAARIKAGFDAEFASHTGEVTGHDV